MTEISPNQDLTRQDFSECDVITDERSLRQGDIFVRISASSDPWQRYGVVITADCDIAQEKHHQIISYVPILSATDYLGLFYLPKQLRRTLRAVKDELLGCIRSAQAKIPGYPEPISEDAAVSWVLRAPAEDIADDLRLVNRDRIRLVELCKSYSSADRAVSTGNFSEQLACAISLRAKSSKSHEKSRDKIWEEISDHMQQLPGDAFFLSALGPNETDGYVAYLRLIREMRQTEIALRQTDLRDATVSARRICRLKSPYIYRLTQQLADVFSSIGLPREYEAKREHAMATIAKQHPTKVM
ncbi:hypothetical protein [Sorangium sp. So ce1182]|uniref:hypothetical protein n=1 Tax=Sorangium sp. So ce1182 TaxID=3133334 RepID=UPI003F62AB51